MDEKRTFTGRIAIADAQELILDFDIISVGNGFELVTRYKVDEQEIIGLSNTVIFDKDWIAKKHEQQNIINWVKNYFEKKQWELP